MFPYFLKQCILHINIISASVFRNNQVEDHVVDQNSGLTTDELRSAHGKELFKNSQFLVRTHRQHVTLFFAYNIYFLSVLFFPRSVFCPLLLHDFSFFPHL